MLQNLVNNNYTKNVIMSPLSVYDALATYGSPQKIDENAYMDDIQVIDRYIDRQGFHNLINTLHVRLLFF
jgi:hypothetical protein